MDMSVIDQPGFEVDDDSWNTFVYLSGGSGMSYSANPSYSWYPDKMGRCEILQLEAGATGICWLRQDNVDLTDIDTIAFNYRCSYPDGFTGDAYIVMHVAQTLGTYLAVKSIPFSSSISVNQYASADVSGYSGNHYLFVGLMLTSAFHYTDYTTRLAVYFDNLSAMNSSWEYDNIYVDPVNGSDTNAGTQTYPLASLSLAASRVNINGSVHIKAGSVWSPSSQIAPTNRPVTYYVY